MTVLDEKKGGNTAYSNTASNALIKLNMHIILVKLDHLTQRRHEFVSLSMGLKIRIFGKRLIREVHMSLMNSNTMRAYKINRV